MTQITEHGHFHDFEDVGGKNSRDGNVESLEPRDSLTAFMRAIKFHVPRRNSEAVERDFAQLHPRARQVTSDDSSAVPSAN